MFRAGEVRGGSGGRRGGGHLEEEQVPVELHLLHLVGRGRELGGGAVALGDFARPALHREGHPPPHAEHRVGLPATGELGAEATHS